MTIHVVTFAVTGTIANTLYIVSMPIRCSKAMLGLRAHLVPKSHIDD